MSNYSKTTDFAAKDALATGNANKIVKGTEIDDEFDAIQTAVNSKADINNQTHTGTTVITTVDINAGAIDNVSIGASTPATTLDVDNINVNGNTISSTDTDGDISLTPNGAGRVNIDNGIDITTSSGNNVVFKGASSTSTGGFSFETDTTEVGTIGVNGNNGQITISADPAGAVDDSYIRLFTDGSERVRIMDDGKVGINKNAPTEQLEVGGNVKATAFIGDGAQLTSLPTGFTWTSQDMSGLSNKAFTGLPSDITEIVVLMSDLVAAGNNEPRIQLGYGSTTWKTSGYISLTNTVRPSFERPYINGFSEGFITARDSDTNDRITSVFRLYKTDTNVFVGDGQSIVYELSGGVVDTSAVMWVGTYTGMVDLGNTLTALRVNRQGGNTTNFTSGTVTLGYR